MRVLIQQNDPTEKVAQPTKVMSSLLQPTWYPASCVFDQLYIARQAFSHPKLFKQKRLVTQLTRLLALDCYLHKAC